MCSRTPRRMKTDHRRDACATLFSQEEFGVATAGHPDNMAVKYLR